MYIWLLQCAFLFLQEQPVLSAGVRTVRTWRIGTTRGQQRPSSHQSQPSPSPHVEQREELGPCKGWKSRSVVSWDRRRNIPHREEDAPNCSLTAAPGARHPCSQRQLITQGHFLPLQKHRFTETGETAQSLFISLPTTLPCNTFSNPDGWKKKKIIISMKDEPAHECL